ncbi:hypothetical protein AUH73_05920 [archaeon 13_1_40CM_4_53_4]|nr:MAG: hypothetical protein AUH73_05920 [archaeon 13_1_40CM_4_53_4]OLE58538.1 MAG: hypothetical protein AUG17_06960 [Crenarchaeota archaeon 13_1_20CM_2_53_14]TMI27649.1 MAG: hypothetical protein E6H24_00720 [Candidatus Bathyarchaeota archaeon]
MTLENRRWKAFLRLTGETLVERDDEILDEFKGFVNALKRVGVDYSIIVNVEGGRAERFLGRTGPIRATAHAPTIERRRYKSSEAGP